MAWRIHENVQRGELDNRERGWVRGRLWVDGVSGPVVLELEGNACPDLAGCLLTFENPGKTIPLPPDASFANAQRGTIGDLTASRKVRVPDVPVREFYALRKKGLPAPEHMANCLYLEWFSEANGRVVVESTDYKLTISPPSWNMTPQEEERRQNQAARGFSGFMNKLSDAIEATRARPPEDKEWDEFDYEKLLRESDARTEKYMELLDKFRDHPDRERLIAKEMGWNLSSDDDEPDSGSDSDEDDEELLDLDECADGGTESSDGPLEPEPATEGIDWVRAHDGEIMHPLSLRALNSSVALWKTCEELGLGETNDEDLTKLVGEFETTSAKLAGALNTLAYGRGHLDPAFVVAYLKRGLGHLHAAQAALEKVAVRQLLPTNTVGFTRSELFAIREEILRLMTEFRQQH
jgi:hypothetical protein